MRNTKKMKKLLQLLLFVIAAVGVLLFPQNVKAGSDIKSPYLAEQAIGNAPDLKVYVTGSKMKSDVAVSGNIGDIKFTQNGDITTFKESGDGIHYIYILDNSGSVNPDQLDEVKNRLAKLRKKLGENDTLTIYTAGTDSKTGEKTDVLGKTAEGKDTDSIDEDVKKIKGIETLGSKSETVLYRSINQVLASMDTPAKRTVLIVITDGEDESEGKDMNKTNTLDEVKNAIIPVYGILLNTKKRNPDPEKIEYTKDQILDEKNSRGYYYDCSGSTSGDAVKDAFKKLSDIFENQTYVVNLQTNTNATVGAAELNMKFGENSNATVNLNYSNYQQDTEAPVIAGDIEMTAKNVVSFSLSDQYGVNLDDAKDASHYTIKSKTKSGKESKAKEWMIDSVKAEQDGTSVNVSLVTKEKLYNGDYVLTVTGIKDNSADVNKMNAESEFTVKNGVNRIAGESVKTARSYWWLLVLLLLVIIGVVIIIIVKNKAVKVVEIDPEELNKAETKLIRLQITDRAGMIKNLEWTVEGSLFVGRSNINNIYFDDDRLSKQHFVIEITKLGCYVQDLDSTNGTFVNGVRITQKRLLLDGDIITAGRESFEYHVPKEELPDDDM